MKPIVTSQNGKLVFKNDNIRDERRTRGERNARYPKRTRPEAEYIFL